MIQNAAQLVMSKRWSMNYLIQQNSETAVISGHRVFKLACLLPLMSSVGLESELPIVFKAIFILGVTNQEIS